MAIVLARSAAVQRTQLGVETTYGVAAAATTRLPSLRFRPRPHNDALVYKMEGRKFGSVVVPNREWSAAAIDGPMTYNELPYLLSSLFRKTTSALNTDGVNSDWIIAPQLDATDTPATFTIEHGDNSNTGIKAAGHVVTDLTLDFARAECKLTATTLGQAFVTGQTITAAGGLGAPANVPITPGSVKVYLDTAYNPVPVTQLTHVFSTQIHVAGRWQPEWVLDATGTYTRLVEATPTATVTIKMEADTAGMAQFATYRAGTLVYLTVQAIGPVIGATATHHMFTVAVPLEIKELQEYTDEGGTYAIGYVLQPIDDDTAGFAMQALLTNSQAALV